MENTFISKIHINNVRHIKDFDIPISDTERKHLIITGKNGSGKTSLLEVLYDERNKSYNDSLNVSYSNNIENKNYFRSEKFVFLYFQAQKTTDKFKEYENHEYYDAEGTWSSSFIHHNFLQYLVDLKIVALYEKEKGNLDKDVEIKTWFSLFEKQISTLFQEDTQLLFERPNHGTFTFYFMQKNKLPFNMNEMPAGYHVLFCLVAELVLRSKHEIYKSKDFEGIVLIDEIETHLHVDLQKKVLPFLTAFFPKIQFIVTTHSPFVINSISNAVVCDLEKRIVMEDLSGYSYKAVIENYFGNDLYSDEVKKKIGRYEYLSLKDTLNDDEEREIDLLELFFDSVPKSNELLIKIQEIQINLLTKMRA